VSISEENFQVLKSQFQISKLNFEYFYLNLPVGAAWQLLAKKNTAKTKENFILTIVDRFTIVKINSFSLKKKRLEKN